MKKDVKWTVSVLGLLLVAALPVLSAPVSATSSNAIKLITDDWSSVTVAADDYLPFFTSTQPASLIIIR